MDSTTGVLRSDDGYSLKVALVYISSSSSVDIENAQVGHALVTGAYALRATITNTTRGHAVYPPKMIFGVFWNAKECKALGADCSLGLQVSQNSTWSDPLMPEKLGVGEEATLDLAFTQTFNVAEKDADTVTRALEHPAGTQVGLSEYGWSGDSPQPCQSVGVQQGPQMRGNRVSAPVQLSSGKMHC